MQNVKCLITLICLGLALAGLAQQPFTPGNIVVYRVGDGTATLTSNAAPVFLDEFTPSGTLVQSIAMPTAVGGGNNVLTVTGSLNSAGNLNLSANGRYLVVPGNNALVGSAIGSSTAAVIGLVNFNATVNTSTAVTDLTFGANSGDNKSAVSDEGNRLWFVANRVNGGINGSTIRSATLGNSTSVELYGADNQTFTNANITSNQLYVNYQAGPTVTIYSVGTGLPTTASQTFNPLPGLPTSQAQILAGQFVFADLDAGVPGNDVLYFADQSIAGIQKFSLVGGLWTSNGGIGNGSDRYAGLTLSVSGATVSLFATKRGTNGAAVRGGDLVSLTDNSGYNGTLTATPTLLSSIEGRFGIPSVAAYRGVALVPQPFVKVSAKIFLQGSYSTTLSRHKDVSANWALTLNNNALAQPYNAAAFGNYAGTESVAASFFASTAATTDITDWVLVELRDAATPTTVIARRAALVREDGKVVDLDGISDVDFPGVNPGNYYIAIRHRNHLAVRSSSAVAISGTATTYDFTTAQTQAYQNPAILTNTAMKELGTGTVFGMWGGNGNSNTSSRASGGLSLNDYLYLTSSVLGGNISLILGPPSSAAVYNSADMNMDGVVRASGGLSLNDYLFLTSTVLGGNISLILNQHL